MDHRIALLCNPTRENARALSLLEAAVTILRQRSISFTAYVSEWPQQLNDHTAVWIFGGDGTLHHFINQYPDITLPLALFAGGSGNDFYWMLYGNRPLQQQVQACLQGSTRLVDAGWCNGSLFLNGLGIGFDGAVVKDLLGKKKLAGKATYLLSIMKNILRYQEMPMRFTVYGDSFEKEAFMVSVANGQRYGGGFHVAPKAAVDDGLLDLSVIGRINPINRMRYLPVMEKGAHLELPFVSYAQGPSILVETESEVPAHLDGEFLSATSFEVRCLAGKFRFFA